VNGECVLIIGISIGLLLSIGSLTKDGQPYGLFDGGKHISKIDLNSGYH
jgi:hypothetical protein